MHSWCCKLIISYDSNKVQRMTNIILMQWNLLQDLTTNPSVLMHSSCSDLEGFSRSYLNSPSSQPWQMTKFPVAAPQTCFLIYLIKVYKNGSDNEVNTISRCNDLVMFFPRSVCMIYIKIFILNKGLWIYECILPWFIFDSFIFCYYLCIIIYFYLFIFFTLHNFKVCW